MDGLRGLELLVLRSLGSGKGFSAVDFIAGVFGPKCALFTFCMVGHRKH